MFNFYRSVTHLMIVVLIQSFAINPLMATNIETDIGLDELNSSKVTSGIHQDSEDYGQIKGTEKKSGFNIWDKLKKTISWFNPFSISRKKIKSMELDEKTDNKTPINQYDYKEKYDDSRWDFWSAAKCGVRNAPKIIVCGTIIIFLIWMVNPLAGYAIDNHGIPYQSDMFKVEQSLFFIKDCVQSINPIKEHDYPSEWDQCIRDANIPTLDRNITEDLYSDSTFVGGGGHNVVASTVVNEDRPFSGINAGDVIAVRVGEKSSCRSLAAYGRLAMSRPYTNLFMDVYGTYFAERMEMDGITLRNTGREYRHVEMEYVPYSFGEDGRPGRINYGEIPDSVLFESCVGEWAQEVISGVYISDYKYRHFGYQLTDTARVYRIGRRQFLMNNPITPRRFDYDAVTGVILRSSIAPARYLCPALYMFRSGMSHSLSRMYEESGGSLGLFPFLFEAFRDYEIDSNQFREMQRNGSNFDYFELPGEYLPREAFQLSN